MVRSWEWGIPANRVSIDALSKAQKYALVWKVFFAGDGEEENVNIDVFFLDQPSWYVVAATETEEPDKWLAYAQDRKQEDARYSIASFRRDIQQAGMFQPSTDVHLMQDGFQQNMPLPTLEQRACPWIKVLCVRSGKPVAGYPSGKGTISGRNAERHVKKQEVPFPSLDPLRLDEDPPKMKSIHEVHRQVSSEPGAHLDTDRG